MSVVALEDKVRGPRALGTKALFAVAGLTVLAAVLRFVRIRHQGFWYDEADTAELVRLSLGKMLGLLPQRELTPPLYYGVAWVWARIFGFGEAGLRSLSAVAGVLTVPVIYGAGAKLISRRAGVIAAALTATSPLLIWYSQEARSYELLTLLAATSLLAFAYALSSPTPRTLAVWVGACVLALATHYFAGLAVVPEAAWLLVAHRGRRSVQVAVGMIAVAGLALIPLAISQRSGIPGSNFIAGIPLDLRLSQLTPQFLLGFGAPAGRWLRTIDALVVLSAAALLWRRGDRDERRGALAAGGVALTGAVVMLALIAAGVDVLITRNIIVLWLPLALVVAAGLGARRAGVLGLAGAAVLCATGVVGVVGVAVNRSLQRPDWRPVARALGPAPARAGRAIVIQHYGNLLPLLLYQPRLRYFPRGGALVDELDVISMLAPQHHACWWGAACNLIPAPAPASLPVPGFQVVGEQRIAQFTLLRLRSASPLYVTRQMVARALTTTQLRHGELILQPPAAGR